MGKPDGPKPPPPSSSTYPPNHPSIHPSILFHPSPSKPAAWPPSAGTWPGSLRGKDCLCLKVTTRSAVPGLGLVPPIPRPTELEFRGRPKSQKGRWRGETQWPASQFISSYKPAEDPRFSLAPPKRNLGRGRTGRATGGEMDRAAFLWPLALPRKGGEHEEGRGVPKAGGGSPPLPPVGRSRSPLSSVALYPGKDQGGNRGARFEIGEQ